MRSISMSTSSQFSKAFKILKSDNMDILLVALYLILPRILAILKRTRNQNWDIRMFKERRTLCGIHPKPPNSTSVVLRP
ncbi:hypothetical protein BDQ12DRAFT_683219 [Crucibulum laeve]|uniref:Uncharacterized protein n=1 Tax=Crucibulum laeve TaxID=68775 RepID=A0A5C3M135_9AGAR|nr:hypothetical protein BDQ12DRAFT_683219 [Crucibulum laeve]